MFSKTIVFLFVFMSWQVKADLRMYYLDIKLSSEQSCARQGDIIPFWISFKNTDEKSHTYLLSSNNPSKKKVIFFSFFTVDENDFYTEVFRESQEITMDTSLLAWHNIRNIGAGESFTFPVYFNDEKNYSQQSQAHHRLADIPPGDYQVLAWYRPWNSTYAEQFYNPINPFGHDDLENPASHKLDMPTDGLQSNYLPFTIQISDYVMEPNIKNTDYCPKNCSFCRKIEKEKWGKVKRTIKRETKHKGKNRGALSKTSWSQTHKNVAWLGPNPEAILLSLPTWTGRNIIFKNANGYHYYSLRWQLGKIHRVRSRLAYPFYWMGFRRPPFRTSNGDYKKLVTFKRNGL